MIDFSAEDRAKSPGDLKEVTTLAMNLINIEQEIAVIEDQLKTKREALGQIEAVDLPDLMESLNITNITLPNGWTVKMDSYIKASLPTASAMNKDTMEADDLRLRHSAGLKFMREQGAGDLIKNALDIDLGKSSDTLADQILAALGPFNVKVTRNVNVHHSTLTAYVKERIEGGLELPYDTFAVYTGKKVKVKQPKTKKRG